MTVRQTHISWTFLSDRLEEACQTDGRATEHGIDNEAR